MNQSTELFIKISHNIVDNPKIINLSCEARWAFIESLAYAARNMTDGLIDRRILSAKWSQSIIGELTTNDDDNPSWVLQANGDVVIYGFAEWQMTTDKRAELSAIRSESGRRGAANRWQKDGKPIANDGKSMANEWQADSKPMAEIEEEKEIEKEVRPLAIASPLFDEFWQIWPRHDGKANALKAWAKAIQKIPAVDLVEAARDYSQKPDLPDRKFIPHAATWLNGERWNDEPEPALPDPDAWMNVDVKWGPERYE